MAFSSLALVQPAAASCGKSLAPWVQLEASALAPTQARAELLATHLLRQMQAELSARAIAVCVAAEGEDTKALATVQVRASLDPSLPSTFELTIRDNITSKLVSRPLDLANVPESGRPLALAVAADELLRASWSELALQPERASVPLVVRQTIARTPESVEEPRLRLEASFSGDKEATLPARLGGDMGLAYLLVGRLSLLGRLGWRGSPDLPAPDGHVESSLVLAELGARVRVTPKGHPWGAEVGALWRVGRMAVEGAPDSAARGYRASLVTSAVGLQARGSMALAATFCLFADVGGGAYLRSADAEDGAAHVAVARGPIFSWALGAGWSP